MNTIILSRKDGSADMVETSSLAHMTWADILDMCDVSLLGQGISRKVYSLSSSVVLKISTGTKQQTRAECALWNEISEEHEAFFARIYCHADDYSWSICERIDNVGEAKRTGEASEVWDEYEVSDIHPDNYGARADGTPCLVDYGIHMSDCYVSEWCECGECECEECYPEGCECEDLEGCNLEDCDVCLEDKDEAKRIAELAVAMNLGSLFIANANANLQRKYNVIGYATVRAQDDTVYCWGHRPKDEAKREHCGQLALGLDSLPRVMNMTTLGVQLVR